MGPGRPTAVVDDLRYLGRTSMILRKNSNAFHAADWTPLLPTLKDSIWVNKWPLDNKTVYTILSFDPAGHEGPLFEIDDIGQSHYVNLWNHEEIEPVTFNGRVYLPASVEQYKSSYKNTRREGNIACIAAFHKHIQLNDQHHQLYLSVDAGDEIILWKSDASYGNEFMSIPIEEPEIKLDGSWLAGEDKIVIQLFKENELIDERIHLSKSGKPWLISENNTTYSEINKKTSEFIKGGSFSFVTEQNDQFIPYPGPANPIDTILHDFYIDKHPVSNAEFKAFVEASGYTPEKSANFLKHWNNGNYPDSVADAAVRYICYKDALAYAAWAGKRLPTELEWQYAMSKKELEYGQLWEMTNDHYNNGSHAFVIIKGGSYYKPESSWWYIQGGKQPPERQQMLLQVSPGFDRASTVGFRCVQDPE